MALPQVQHRAQRVVNDDGSITAASFASTENGTASFNVGTPFRVRSQLDETANKNNNTTPQWQARTRASSSAAWSAWAALSTGATYLKLTGSTNVATGTQIGTQRLSNAPSGTFAANVFDFCETSTGVAQIWNFTGDQYTEGECCVSFTTAAVDGYGAQVRLWPQTYGTTATNYNLATVASLGSTAVPSFTVQTGLEAALQRQNLLRIAGADAGLQATFTRQTGTDAGVSALLARTADADAALRALVQATADADAAVRSATALATDLDASVTLGITAQTRTADLDAGIAALRTAQAGLDAALEAALERTTGLDAQINAAGVNAVLASADAAIQRLMLAQATLDAAVALVQEVTAGADARISAPTATQTVQADFDAALRRLLVATLTADAALSATGTVTFGADARLYDASLVSPPTPGRTLTPVARDGYPIKPHRRLLEVR